MRESLLCQPETQTAHFSKTLRSVWRDWCTPHQNGHKNG
jgi:hypothetical protein